MEWLLHLITAYDLAVSQKRVQKIPQNTYQSIDWNNYNTENFWITWYFIKYRIINKFYHASRFSYFACFRQLKLTKDILVISGN